MNIINGDILEIDEGIICHQVNCRGFFNKGLAQKIRQKYPVVYQNYIDYHNKFGWNLGDIQVINISKTLSVCNIAGQLNYGKGLQTDYKALRFAMEGLSKIYLEDTRYNPCYIPYGMGCGLAGGDWEIVSKIIEEIIPNAVIIKYLSI
jgi:O-acetyl-ADP-ribose deacetylase (regulator of RNase III)